MKKRSVPYSKLKKYTFKKGDHDQSQLAIPRVFLVKGGLSKIVDNVAMWAFELDPSCWFKWVKPDGTPDMDIKDWNYKWCGWAPTLEKGNNNGVMFAGRPNPDVEGEIECCFYQNIDGKNYPREDRIFKVQIDPNNKIRIYCRLKRESQKRLEMEVWADRSSDSTQVLPVQKMVFTMAKDYTTYREIFLWFGGENNADGEFGGTPSADITLYADRC
jgi:hypothetical protein